MASGGERRPGHVHGLRSFVDEHVGRVVATHHDLSCGPRGELEGAGYDAVFSREAEQERRPDVRCADLHRHPDDRGTRDGSLERQFHDLRSRWCDRRRVRAGRNAR